MIRAVTFDLWETLIHEDAERERLRTERRFDLTREFLGRPLDQELLVAAHGAVWQRLEGLWAADLDVSIRGQVEIFLECLGERPEPSRLGAFVDSYSSVTLQFPPRLGEASRGVLERLASRGLPLGLICNTGRTPGRVLRPLLERWGILGRFKIALFSDEELLRKPNPEIFRKALTALGAAPGEAVHVGDTESSDIAGARGAGMHAIHLDGRVSLSDVPGLVEGLSHAAEGPLPERPPEVS